MDADSEIKLFAHCPLSCPHNTGGYISFSDKIIFYDNYAQYQCMVHRKITLFENFFGTPAPYTIMCTMLLYCISPRSTPYTPYIHRSLTIIIFNFPKYRSPSIIFLRTVFFNFKLFHCKQEQWCSINNVVIITDPPTIDLDLQRRLVVVPH